MSAPSIGCPLASLTIPSSTELAAHALATKSINPTKPIRSDFSKSINNIPSLWTFGFACAVEIFSVRWPGIDVPWYNFGVCAATRSPLRATGGVRFTAPHSLRLLDRADTIVIPGWRPAVPPPRLLIRKLQNAHARGARLCSICTGAFVLAATGLLDGKPATTHWIHVALLQERYPEIEVRSNDLYVDTGRIITSAGSAAGLDMMLHVVRRDHGAKIANLVAQG